MGNEDNYTGLPQTSETVASLAKGYEVKPANASYIRNLVWSSDNESVAEYMDTHSNGFIAHSEGTAVITAEIDQGT